jgi:hypothetical protein
MLKLKIKFAFIFVFFVFFSKAQCPIAEIVKNNKSKITAPYVYDGFSVSNLNFDDKSKTIRSEFMALKGQKYKLFLCSSGFSEIVKVKIYYKHPKKDEVAKLFETTIGGLVDYYSFEPAQAGTYYIDYELPPTANPDSHKECVMLLISYK